jgi:hypothetical protein
MKTTPESAPVLSARGKFVADYVAARVVAWEKANNLQTADGRSNRKQSPSKEHLATWADMGAEQADREGIKE